MIQNKILSSKYNMSWGIFPGILSMLLCYFLPHQTAIYWGTAVGILSSFFFIYHHKALLQPYLLYTTTVMLFVLTIIHWVMPCTCPPSLYILTLEIAILLPAIAILFLKRRLRKSKYLFSNKKTKHIQKQSIEANIVSARIIVLIGFFHLSITLLIWLIHHPINDTLRFFLLTLTPLLLFIAAVIINQQCIGYFNSLMKEVIFLPIINSKGDVIGKCLPTDSKIEYIHPVIRIAVSAHGLLLLRPRLEHQQTDKGKNDILIEEFLHFGETLEEGARRMIKQYLPDASTDALRFHFVYPFEHEYGHRLVYLFTLCLPDEKALQEKRFTNGKLWTFKQIEHELGKHFFSKSFEYEYEQLKAIVITREKYRQK